MKGSSSSGQKRYEKFIESYRNAYPQLSKEQQFRKGQELWKKVKNDAEEYGKTLMELKAKAAGEKNKNAKVWSNFISPPTKKKKTTAQAKADTKDVQVIEGKHLCSLFYRYYF